MAKASPGRERSANKEKAEAPGPATRKKAKTAAPPLKQAGAKKADRNKADLKKPDLKKPDLKKAGAKQAGAKQAGAAKEPAKTAAKQAEAKPSGPAKKTPALKTAAAKMAPARTVAVKQAVPRRPAVRVAAPIPAARRARRAAAPRKAPSARVTGKGPQVFTVSHLNEADFKADGLRSYAQYRDLGIAAATAGLCLAHVIRFIPPCTDAARRRHVHEADLQLVYVLKGWMKNEFEGHGEQMMSAGSCWLQPSGIKHTVLDYSPDCEVLEIIVPADFRTEEVV